MDEGTEQFSEQEGIDLQGEGNETAPVAENTAPQGNDLLEQVRQIMREERALTAQQIATETAKAYRAMQSMSDKKAAQVKGMAKQQLEAMKATGAQFTPEMESQYVNRIVNDYVDSTRDESPEPAQAPNRTAPESNPVRDAAMATVNMFAEESGVEIDDAKSVQLEKLFSSVRDPKSYREFLKNAKTLFAKPDANPPAARIASVAGNGGSAAATAEAYKREVMKYQGDPTKWRECKEKYRKLGVDVDSVRFTQSK